MPAAITAKLQHRPVAGPTARRNTFHRGFLFSAALLGVIVPGLLWLSTPDLSITFGSFLLMVLTVVSGIRMAHLSSTLGTNYIQIVFWLFVYVWFGLAGSLQAATATFPSGFDKPDEQTLGYESLVIIIGIVSYEVGVAIASRQKLHHKAWTSPRTFPFRRFLILTGIGTALSVIAVIRMGGISAALTTRADANEATLALHQQVSTTLLMGWLEGSAPFICLAVALYVLVTKSHTLDQRRAVYMLVGTLITYNVVANFPPRLARVTLGSYIFTIAVIFAYKYSAAKRWAVPVITVALVVVFPYTDFFRTQAGYSLSDVKSPSITIINKPDYDAFQMMGATIHYSDLTGFDYGHQLSGGALFFVPRALWPGKPRGTGWTVSKYFAARFSNLSCPLWAELYTSAGVLSVIAGFLVFGFVSRYLERKSEYRNPAAFLLMAVIAGMQTFILRGDLMNAMANVCSTLPWVLALTVPIRMKK